MNIVKNILKCNGTLYLQLNLFFHSPYKFKKIKQLKKGFV